MVYFFILGGCCGSTRKRTIVGGWAWAWWLVTDVQRLSLEVMTLNPMCEGVETAQGVPLTVTGVAQCKIMKVYTSQIFLLVDLFLSFFFVNWVRSQIRDNKYNEMCLLWKYENILRFHCYMNNICYFLLNIFFSCWLFQLYFSVVNCWSSEVMACL